MKTLSKANFALRFSLILVALCLISLEATRVLADPGGVRTGKYSQQDIIPVRAKLRFPTLIVLSQNEDILDFATGGKESGSSKGRTIFATSIPRRQEFAATFI